MGCRASLDFQLIAKLGWRVTTEDPSSESLEQDYSVLYIHDRFGWPTRSWSASNQVLVGPRPGLGRPPTRPWSGQALPRLLRPTPGRPPTRPWSGQATSSYCPSAPALAYCTLCRGRTVSLRNTIPPLLLFVLEDGRV